jgi:hypothetical protein
MALGCSDLTDLCCIAGAYPGSLTGNWARFNWPNIFILNFFFVFIFILYM